MSMTLRPVTTETHRTDAEVLNPLRDFGLTWKVTFGP